MDVVSQCALRVANVVWRPGHGGFAFTVVCKATFELRPELSPLAALQEPIAMADWYFGEAGVLAFASELVPAKKRPEVLLTGHAYAPEGQSVSSLAARLVVGEIDKTIQVVGDRQVLRDGNLSDPERFQRMSLGWERAATGPDGANPAGRSRGGAAPNLLPAGLPPGSRGDRIPAVGFGPLAPLWPSRAACLGRHAAGWDPRRWHEQPLPADIDLGYFNAAPPDQQRTLPFGEEAIYLENLHPRVGRLSTKLAAVLPAATVDRGSGPQALSLRCDTLIIDTDRGIAMLVWRAHVLLDRPDGPGRVVVTGPSIPQASSPERAAADDAISTTMGPGFVIPAAVLPFLAAQRATVPRREAPPAESASDLPFVRPAPVAMERAPELVQPPPPASDTPAPPPMIGPIPIVAAEIEAAPDSDAPVVVEVTRPEVEIEIEIEIDFDLYPPSRCGGIAARLACAVGDETGAAEILRAASLGAGQWQRVHEHWLDRIREEVARSRKKLLSEYDGAYVAALEAERGAIALAEYARLAEAAERGAVAAALTEGELPEGAWPRIHRVWIGRMVKDARLGKQVRGAIEALRVVG